MTLDSGAVFQMLRNDPDVQAWRAEERAQVAAARRTIEVLFDREDYEGAAQYAMSVDQLSCVPVILWDRWKAESMDDDQLRRALPPTWIFNDHLEPLLSENQWIEMFAAVGYVARTSWSEIVSPDGSREALPMLHPPANERPPKNPIRAWRGTLAGRGGRGMSWSTDQKVATQIAQGRANRDHQPGGIYVADIPPEAILAMFSGDGEQEIVVNPNRLPAVAVELVETLEALSPSAQTRVFTHERQRDDRGPGDGRI